MDKYEVIYAKVHEGVFLPEFGNFGNTLPGEKRTLPNLKMYTDGAVLYVSASPSAGRSIVTMAIPMGNIVCMKLGAKLVDDSGATPEPIKPSFSVVSKPSA